MTAYKVQQTAAVHWQDQQTAVMSELSSSATPVSAAAAAARLGTILQPPDWYMTGTGAIIDIAAAVTITIQQSNTGSVQQWAQHHGEDDSNRDIGNNEGLGIPGALDISLKVVLLVRIINAGVYHMLFFRSEVTELAAAVGVAGDHLYSAEAAAAFRTATSQLPINTPTSLPAVARVVSQVFVMLRQMPVWQADEVDCSSHRGATVVARRASDTFIKFRTGPVPVTASKQAPSPAAVGMGAAAVG